MIFNFLYLLDKINWKGSKDFRSGKFVKYSGKKVSICKIEFLEIFSSTMNEAGMFVSFFVTWAGKF